MFRLPRAQALINRMGFNNQGWIGWWSRCAALAAKGVLGINIGKNADTPVERAADDYLLGLRKGLSLGQLRRGQHFFTEHAGGCVTCNTVRRWTGYWRR